MNKIPSNIGPKLQELHKKVEIGLATIVAQNETQNFLQREKDFVADSMTNKFLQMVQEESDKTKERLDQLENQRWAAGSATDAGGGGQE